MRVDVSAVVVTVGVGGSGAPVVFEICTGEEFTLFFFVTNVDEIRLLFVDDDGILSVSDAFTNDR